MDPRTADQACGGAVAADCEAITAVVHRYEPFFLAGIVIAGLVVLWWGLRHRDHLPHRDRRR
jgi:hypothetical protein